MTAAETLQTTIGTNLCTLISPILQWDTHVREYMRAHSTKGMRGMEFVLQKTTMYFLGFSYAFCTFSCDPFTSLTILGSSTTSPPLEPPYARRTELPASRWLHTDEDNRLAPLRTRYNELDLRDREKDRTHTTQATRRQCGNDKDKSRDTNDVSWGIKNWRCCGTTKAGVEQENVVVDAAWCLEALGVEDGVEWQRREWW